MPIPLLVLALAAVAALAWISVAAARDRRHRVPRPLEFVCTIVHPDNHWRWAIRDAGTGHVAPVDFAWGEQATLEGAMRAGHECFSRWVARRPDPEGYRLVFEGEGVEAEWVG